MSKVRIYIPKEKIENSIKIDEIETLHKLKDVLSLEEHEAIYVFDGDGKEYTYEIDNISRNQVLLKNQKINRNEAQVERKIILGFPLLKEQKAEYILEKATELGVNYFWPFISDRSIRQKPSVAKMTRWQRIIQESARQSDRLWLPGIGEPLEFNDLVRKDFKTKLCGSINGKYLKNASGLNTHEIFLIIGPEGDFSPREFDEMKRQDFQFIKLAENILRVETASILMAGIVNYLLKQSVF